MNIYERPTPRTDAEIAKIEAEIGDGPPCISPAAIDVAVRHKLCRLARRLEQELETCRDAHMANCLAADTLRREIRELREPEYVEIGYLLKNEYGFVSAHVPNLAALPVGQTTVYSPQPQPSER